MTQSLNLPTIPATPSPLDVIYKQLALSAQDRAARYGKPFGLQQHHLKMAKGMTCAGLVAAFVGSVDAYEGYANRCQPFFGKQRTLTEAHRPTDDESLKTSSIAWWLEQSNDLVGEGGERLGLQYVEREIVPLRAAGYGKGTSDLSRRSRRLDLLLTDDQRAPVVTEVKAKTDQHPFYGMIQVLLLAAQLASVPQRERLREHHGVAGSGPMGVCLVLAANARYFFEPPGGWVSNPPKYKPQLAHHAARLCEGFIADPRVHRHIDSITWLEARMADGRLVFQERLRMRAERSATT